MPIKKIVSRARVGNAPVKAVPAAKRPHNFWLFYSFLVLFTAVVTVSLILGLVLKRQEALVSYLSNEKPNQPAFSLPTEKVDPYRYTETRVSGWWLAYRECPESFTGSCDDAVLYKLAASGSKEVVLSSVRSLPNAPKTSELLQPLSASADGKVAVFGAWAFGADRNAADKRIWMYEMASGKLIAESDGVPEGSVFSPDYKYAAYAVMDEGDIRDLMIVNLAENKTVSGAKAPSNLTFLGTDGPYIFWKDAKNLAIKTYKTVDGTKQEQGEITVKVK